MFASLKNLTQQLNQLDRPQIKHLIRQHRRGIEKENLRIDEYGHLSKRPHPLEIGPSLTHPYITTDYSEALLEIMTPTFNNFHDIETFLNKIHQFIYANLPDEILWSSSMPCIIEKEEDIPLAHYGSSHMGMMKHIYRRGLGHRYGRLMQSIAGIHYNFSFPLPFWKEYLQQDPPSQEQISAHYFHLIRNFFRYSWALIYLFGAAPAICSCFIKNRSTSLQLNSLGGHTLYGPYATSLRMSDIGYQNNAQNSLQVSYNHVDEYIRDLTAAIKTPHTDFSRLGVKDPATGEYKQLNDHILQIENEFYSSIRPKRVIHSGERPTLALQRRGVEYIEVRTIDLNPYLPLGLDEEQAEFIDTFLTFCLMYPSPPLTHQEKSFLSHNNSLVASQGRDPQCKLYDPHLLSSSSSPGPTVSVQEFGVELLEAMRPIAEMLGTTSILEKQKLKFQDPSLTPSAQILDEIKREGESFFEMSMRYSIKHKEHFMNMPMDHVFFEHLSQLAESAFEEMNQVEQKERAKNMSFEQYLDNYFQ